MRRQAGHITRLLDERPARPGSPMLGLAAALAVGIGIAETWPFAASVPWAIVGGACLLAAAVGRRRHGLAACLLGSAVLALGAHRVGIHRGAPPAGSLAACLGAAPMLGEVTATVLSAPEAIPPPRSLFAPYDRRGPAERLTLGIRGGSIGSRRFGAGGRLVVYVEGAAPEVRVGATIRATGWLAAPRPPSNPGGFDAARAARLTGVAGSMTVPDGALIVVRHARPGTLPTRLLAVRAQVREAARAALACPGRPRSEALLAAMMLGERGDAFVTLGESFRRVGLAHLVAISGLHLGIIAVTVHVLVRRGGPPRRWHGWVTIAVVAAILLLVEVRLPLLRAGVMTIMAAVSGLFDRRLRVGGLVALSAAGLLLWRPGQLLTAGFQLSYAVVLALVYVAPSLERRWFGSPDLAVAGLGAAVRRMARRTLAASVRAWCVATPLTIHHFGLFSPFAVPLGLLALPLTAALLALGVARLPLATVCPLLDTLLEPLQCGAARALLGVVTAGSALPGAAVMLPIPSGAWALSTLAIITAGLARGFTRLTVAALVACALWLLWPILARSLAPPLRVDMLDVGDGTCLLVRCGSTTMLFDAGSATRFDVGRRDLVPALRHLGVTTIDRVLVSHANLDHFGALPDLLDGFPVRSVVLTPAFLAEASRRREGPTARFLVDLADRGVRIECAAAGDRMYVGAARWTWLHPPAGPGSPRRRMSINETSMVIRVEAAGRRLLLCGDVERGALAALLEADLSADIVELPHHGSRTPLARAFVRRVNPVIVLQSTGSRRLERDGWAGALRGRRRLVTAWNGAAWVEVDRVGALRSGSFVGDSVSGRRQLP
ncbi:MAG: ComEC/Rec2 family competence protein [Planctomycetota bacterium]